METSLGVASPPRISVVIPCRDDAPLLERCLERLAAQTVPPWEVIVVDNASTDDTAVVARRHGARVVHEPVPGVPVAAAAGYDRATGDVIARCDADSLPSRRWVERIGHRFTRDARLVGLTGPGWFYNMRRRWALPASVIYMAGTVLGVGAALATVPLWGSNAAFRRSAWEASRALVERTDPRLHDDLDLSQALGPRARVTFDPCLHVGAAARSFRTGAHARDQVVRAMRTLRRGWRVTGPPGQRWMARLGVERWAAPAAPVPATAREHVVVLTEQGEALGTAPKDAVHHERTPLHLAFSCYVVDERGRVLVSRRAWSKATFPGVETNSVCGHPALGETLAGAVRRRARDELGMGLTEIRLVLPSFRYRAEQGGVVENELCPVLVARAVPGLEPRPEPSEVDDAWWVPWPAWRDAVLAGAPGISPWSRAQVVELAGLPDDPRAWPSADPAALPPAARLA